MPSPLQGDIMSLLATSPSEPFVRTLKRLADEAPDAPSILCEGRSVTRGDLDSLSTQMAHAYLELGVAFGDFVTIALPNSIDWYVHFLACWKVGAVPQPVSPVLPAAERAAIVELANSVLVVGAAPGDQPGRTCLPAGFAPPPGTSTEPLPEVVSPAWKAPTSGGSTGRPKVIVAGTGAEGSNAINAWLYGFEDDDVQVVAGPLYHNAPIAHSIPGLLMGHRLVLLPKFDEHRLLDVIEQHRVTWLTLVPTMMHRVHRALESSPPRDLSSVRVLWHMAAKCPEWLKEAWIERLGPDVVVELYGGTEAQALTVITGREWLEHRGSVGRPTIGDMKVFGEDGTELPPGDVGEIYMRPMDGLGSTYRYIGAEAKKNTEGWESLGDLGWKDADGYLYISDRRVDMIVAGGANIYPAEVEAVLDSHPNVLSSVVVGLPDDDLGQRVHALVQVSEPLEADELLRFVGAKLVRYKVPRSLEFIDAPLRDDAGKVRRSAMRDAAAARLGKPVGTSS